MPGELRREEYGQAQKSYRTILIQQIEAGRTELERPADGLLLSSLSAGLDTGFSLLMMGVMLTLLDSGYETVMGKILVANMYSLGFILVILGRSDLFTEHTALAVLPVLDRRATLARLMRLWVIVYAGNLAGAALFATLTWWIAPALNAVEPWAFEEIAGGLVHHPWWVILASAVLAGWLMGELTWVIGASRDTISQVVFVWLVTTAIGFLGLHHVVVGTAEVMAGVLSAQAITWLDFGVFLVWTTIGNAAGGVVFVALLKYGHAHKGNNEDPEYKDSAAGSDAE